MIEIVDIKKDYQLKDQVVSALKGVSMCFRRSEFVSILGPSGCGKTTLLNIIGGLDRYTSGDLIVDGVSTKKFKDKDWDNYRNHKVGFIFQSYNLIPHQTVLENVEIALTLSGIKRAERRKRAIEVLTKVGLGDKLKSRPNQLSGGQMQRVAIARALVNDPEIILADEPTGALDSKTSVQIMELLKEVSKDRLVIMVTHNPELANEYSSRIINLLDGELTNDSMPYPKSQLDKDLKKHHAKSQKQKSNSTFQKTENKKSMSFLSALFLSFKNLLTKKGRTVLVAFAGSIGIIGIALIMAVSSGFSGYVNRIQENTLSTYPITIQAKSIDLSSIITNLFMGSENNKQIEHDMDGVYPKDSISSIFSSVGNSLNSNDLKKFYQHINENYDEIDQYVNAIQYTYNLGLEFYKDQDNANVQPNSNALISMIVKYSLYYMQSKTHLDIQQKPNGNYVITATENADYAFMDKYADLAVIKQTLQSVGSIELSSAQIIGVSFTILGFGNPDNLSSGRGMASMFSNSNIIYEMIDNTNLISEQYDLVGANSRMPSSAEEAILVLDKNNEIDEYVLYTLGLLSDDKMDTILKNLVDGYFTSVKTDYDSILNTEYKVLEECDYFIDDGSGNIIDFRTYIDSDGDNFNPMQYQLCYQNALNNCTNKIKIVGIVRLKDKVENGSLSTGIAYTSAFTNKILSYRNQSVAVSSASLSSLSLDNPASINIYVKSFEAKSQVQNFINNYNKTAENGDEISYTDYVGLIMSAVSTIITSITYVLVAFVSVSLIVSSIMIGIITYISVIERTKEIGILRSVGASKHDISRVFNAETFIVGLFAGILGVTVAGLFTIIISVLLKQFTGIANLASLSPVTCLVLITISVILTLIAGIVPSRIASKKDPVLALRTE